MLSPKKIKHRKSDEEDQIADIINPEVDRQSDFTGIQDEMDNDKMLEQVKDIATSQPESIAAIMEEWLENEKVEALTE